MKTVIEFDGIVYEFTTCRAIAASIGETEYQPAIFCHRQDDENRNGDAVIFGGYSLPLDEDDVRTMSEDYSAWDSDWETLETVIFDDGENE